MFRFFRKHKTLVLTSLAVVVIVLPFFGVGSSFFVSSPTDAIVKVNGEKITKSQFDHLYNQMIRQKGPNEKTNNQEMTNQAFNELIRMTVYDQEASKYGIYVSDLELQNYLAHATAFQKDGKFDIRTYYQTVMQVAGTTPDEFEKMRKRDIKANKLNQLIASAVHVSDAELNQSLQARLLSEKDPKVKKELQEDPEKFKDELRSRQINLVLNDWLNQLNTNLKVSILSENFKKSLSQAPTQ
jgi:peptidyl-prolyl cis-trans isomerase D